jgi:hypothetical protein
MDDCGDEGTIQESYLQLPSSLNAATVAFMRYNLGTNVV